MNRTNLQKSYRVDVIARHPKRSDEGLKLHIELLARNGKHAVQRVERYLGPNAIVLSVTNLYEGHTCT